MIQEDPLPLVERNWEILDHRNMAAGGNIPAWVDHYLDGNIFLIESMEEYQDKYVFISANTGTNFNALAQWQAAFLPDLDFARLAAVRMEKRFLNAASVYPDDEYGSFFEALIRAASDAEWTGAIRMDDFWVYRSFLEDLEGEDFFLVRESFDFLILVGIEKSLLEAQIRMLFDKIEPPVQLTRNQRNAVNRVVERFFDLF